MFILRGPVILLSLIIESIIIESCDGYFIVFLTFTGNLFPIHTKSIINPRNLETAKYCFYLVALCCLICTLIESLPHWFTCLKIVLSNDVSPNPGPFEN